MSNSKQLPTSPTYGNIERNFTRLKYIYAKVPTKVLHFLFTKSTSDRPHSLSLIEYYNGRGISTVRLKKELCRMQLSKIKSDPEGKSFDLTLLCVCLRKGSNGIEDKDEKWKEGNGSLESLITWVKNKRNSLAHDDLSYSNGQLIHEADELRNHLTEILRLAQQLYQLTTASIDQEIDDMNNNINRYLYDNLMPQDFEAYQKQIFFPEQSKFAHKKGIEEIHQHYCKENYSKRNPLKHLVDIKVPQSSEFCSEMVLQDGTNNSWHLEKVTYQDILKGKGDCKTDSIILIEGINGAGKATLVRMIKNDWLLKRANIPKYLSYEDLFLHVKCKKTVIRSFEGLLRHLMPNVAKTFNGEDLKYVVLDQQILIILEGIDELNESTMHLLEEVLQLKRDFGITVMVTTRPERVEYLQQCAKCHQIQTKHIKLSGVPLHQIKTFVTNCYSEIARQHPDTQDIQGLLKFLESTLYSLSDIWRNPHNTQSLTILWAFKYINVGSIRTASELNQEIYKLYCLNLKERLNDFRTTHHLYPSEIDRIIDSFIRSLAKESLLGIMNNHVNLTQEAYQRLKTDCSAKKVCHKPGNDCHHTMVPTEIMIGAFLSEVGTSTITLYRYHHKDLQKFLAAQYICTMVTQNSQGYDVNNIIKTIDDTLSQNAVPVPVSQNILTVTESMMKKAALSLDSDEFKVEEAEKAVDRILKNYNAPKDLTRQICKLIRESGSGPSFPTSPIIKTKFTQTSIDKTVKIPTRHSQVSLPQMHCTTKIRDILEEVCGSTEGEMSKYQQTFMSLLEMLCTKTNPVSDSLKMELLSLLNEAGVNSRQEWISLMNLVRRDACVAVFISQQKDILRGEVNVSDSSLLAYISLLQEMQGSLKDDSTVDIKININGFSSHLTELLDQINMNELRVSVMRLHVNFKRLTVDFMLGKAISTIFRRCKVKKYLGPVTPGMVLPSSIRCLSASIAKIDCYMPIRKFLASNPEIDILVLCLNPRMSYTGIQALQSSPMPSLYLPDISTDDDVVNASIIIHRLAPIDGGQFQRLYFPRATVGFHEIADFMLRLKGIKVYGSLVFPSRCKPVTQRESQDIEALAFTSGFRIQWGISFGIDIDQWEE